MLRHALLRHVRLCELHVDPHRGRAAEGQEHERPGVGDVEERAAGDAWLAALSVLESQFPGVLTEVGAKQRAEDSPTDYPAATVTLEAEPIGALALVLGEEAPEIRHALRLGLEGRPPDLKLVPGKPELGRGHTRSSFVIRSIAPSRAVATKPA